MSLLCRRALPLRRVTIPCPSRLSWQKNSYSEAAHPSIRENNAHTARDDATKTSSVDVFHQHHVTSPRSYYMNKSGARLDEFHPGDGAVRIRAGKDVYVYSDLRRRKVPVLPMWLRDHCQCSQCVHPDTRQRLIETFYDIPADIAIVKAEPVGKDIHVEFSDGHKAMYPYTWLANSGLQAFARQPERQGLTRMTFWTGGSIIASPPSVRYEDVMASDDGVRVWLEKIREFGFCYVDGTPIDPAKTEELLNRIAFVRNTHYGGFYDFTADLASKDTAYTQLGIGPHTDNTYFSDPAGLQMFHLLSHTDGEGGASQLVDGFGAALELKNKSPNAYQILSKIGVHCHASGNEGMSLQPSQTFPVLVHDPHLYHLKQVRWNVADRAAIDMGIEEIEQWYSAAHLWAQILKEREYWEQLKPGRALIFDNWRVLHGRSAFTGKRRICGGYINRDDWISRYKMLSQGKETVLAEVARG